MRLWQKKLAIIAAMNKGYLLDVSGNPAVLTNALARPLQGVIVYGASGGVGDSTGSLKEGYTRLSHIESTGTQYIDTGVTGGGNFGIEADVYIGSLPTDGYHGVFGSKAANRDKESTLYYSANLNSWNGSVRTSTSMQDAQLSPNTRTTVSLKGSVFSHDDVSISVSRGNNNTYPVTLFAVNNAGAVSQFGSFKLYSCKIYTGSTLMRDMVPAKRESDNAIGMYDALNDTFYADAAGGNFVAGREIYKIPVRFGDVPEVGDTITTTWTDSSATTSVTYESEHDVVHKANDIVVSDDEGTTEKIINGAYLQWHYATPYDMPFDAAEAMYTVPSGGLAAGTYYFTVQNLNTTFNGKTYMFTLNAALTEGMQLILSVNTSDFTRSVVRVYDDCYVQTKNTAYGTSGDISVSLWDNESGLPLSGDSSQNSTNGAGELNHMQRIQYGYNRYSQSAIRQWLNSAEPARKANDPTNYPGWWNPQNKWDRAPAQAFKKPGFLSGYNADFVAAMRPVKVAQALNTKTDGGAIEYTYDKVFLPSLTEMNIQPQATEGVIWDYYKQLFEDNPVEGRTNWNIGGTYPILKSYAINAKSTAVNTRLHSANRDSACGIWGIDNSGGTFAGNASVSVRQRPACVIEINDNANKTINLYTPQQLTAAADTFAVNIPTQTATLTAGGVSTDVSAMQDWEQDFELVKGDNVVSVDTEVQPSKVEWRYWSSRKGE
jgi:hypothetical protein